MTTPDIPPSIPPNFLPKNLEGKAAFVTGASSGLGRRTALVLARAGAKVALAARRVEKLAELSGEIAAFDGRAMPIRVDVTDAASVREAVEAAETELGPLGILVNCAGISVEKWITELGEADFDSVMNTNVKGTWLVAQEVGRRMIRHGAGGKIVNIASVLAQAVLPNLSIYCMSKAAVVQMTRAMALEWARYGIRVNALAPGYIKTEMTREHFGSEAGQAHIAGLLRGRIGRPADMDGVLMLLVSEASSFITGSVITLDDGQTLKAL